MARSTPPAVPAVAEPPAPPALASRRDVAALAAGPAAAPRGPAWPSAVPSQAEAAEALERVRSGTAAADAAPGLADVLANVLSNLSELERSVLADEPQPVDPRPIRDAAVMRVRVAAALASVPPPGEEVDTAAVSALLAEMDALLSQVSAVAAEAPPDAQQSLEAVRNALVREAIDFSEAVQRASPAGDAPAAVAPRATARPAQARLLSMEAAPERRSVRQRAGWIVLVVVLLATATYHGWRWYEKRAARAALRKPGVPAGLIELPAVPGTPRMLVPSRSDEPLDPAEVARFRSAEEAKGNDVREENGFIYVTPSRRSTAPARSPAPAPGAPATGTRPAGGPSPPGAPDSPAHQEKP